MNPNPRDDRRNRAAEVGIVLGVVFTTMGLVYGNSGIWIPGLIVMAIGVWSKQEAED